MRVLGADGLDSRWVQEESLPVKAAPCKLRGRLGEQRLTLLGQWLCIGKLGLYFSGSWINGGCVDYL